MKGLKRLQHTWPRQGPAERRLFPRLKSRFPLVLDPGERAASLSCWTIDITQGGIRFLAPRMLDVFTIADVAFQVPITEKDGTFVMHVFHAPATILRCEPDEPDDVVEEYDVALKFNNSCDERDRVLAICMLQMHLFDPESELT
jgi:hypothetical protein